MVDASYFGGYWAEGFRDIMYEWSRFGVFDILLPLILIFAVVFAILEKINVFGNRGVNLIVALVIGFFTISNPYVSGFFMYLFSNLGLGIAVLVALIVLLGVAIEPSGNTWKWLFGIVGALLFLVVLGRSGAFTVLFGDSSIYWLYQNSAAIIILVFVALAVIAVIAGTRRAGSLAGAGMAAPHRP